MKDIYVHQYAKGQPNQFRGGAVISADACTHLPPYTNSIFTTFYYFIPFIYTYFTLKCLAKYIPRG